MKKNVINLDQKLKTRPRDNTIRIRVQKTHICKAALNTKKNYNSYDFKLTAYGTDQNDLEAFAVELETVGTMAIDGHMDIDLHGHASIPPAEDGQLSGSLLWLPEKYQNSEGYIIRGIFKQALETWREEFDLENVPLKIEFQF